MSEFGLVLFGMALGMAVGIFFAVMMHSTRRPTVKGEELLALTSMLIMNDPWPGTQADLARLQAMADKFSREHGWESWIVAYHDLIRKYK